MEATVNSFMPPLDELINNTNIRAGRKERGNQDANSMEVDSSLSNTNTSHARVATPPPQTSEAPRNKRPRGAGETPKSAQKNQPPPKTVKSQET